MSLLSAVVLAAVAGSTAQWSAISPQTAGKGSNLVVAGVGWPGVEVGYERGLSDRFDLGARVSYNYGYEALLTRLDGFRFQAVLRFLLAQGERVSLGLTMAPGALVYFPRGGTVTGLTLPVLATLGVDIDRGVTLSFCAELPIWVRFGAGGGLIVPFLLGFGVETRLSPVVSIWVRGRGGPTFFSYGSRPVTTIDAKAGIGLHF